MHLRSIPLKLTEINLALVFQGWLTFPVSVEVRCSFPPHREVISSA